MAVDQFVIHEVLTGFTIGHHLFPDEHHVVLTVQKSTRATLGSAVG
jgi:hypothetical protein